MEEHLLPLYYTFIYPELKSIRKLIVHTVRMYTGGGICGKGVIEWVGLSQFLSGEIFLIQDLSQKMALDP